MGGKEKGREKEREGERKLVDKASDLCTVRQKGIFRVSYRDCFSLGDSGGGWGGVDTKGACRFCSF